MPAVAVRSRRAPRRPPPRLTRARRDSGACCPAAVRIACDCGVAWACRHHQEQHGQHADGD
ncbi:hypothetical protein Mx4_p03 [Myxococcus phage Mx4]|nr:hypothetical protein Mx4_p03 [Myxococcus phage Mx4]